jgi:hypothetical protein
MERYPEIPPPPPPLPSTRGRFSMRTLFFGVAIAALLLSLAKAGAFLVILGVLSAILLAIGLAVAISRLSSLFAGIACIGCVIVVLLLGIAIAQRQYAFRSQVMRWLGEDYGTRENVDIVMIWLCAVGLSALLGAVLGWAIAKSEEPG